MLSLDKVVGLSDSDSPSVDCNFKLKTVTVQVKTLCRGRAWPRRHGGPGDYPPDDSVPLAGPSLRSRVSGYSGTGLYLFGPFKFGRVKRTTCTS